MNSSSDFAWIFKIILLGDSGVGKTSLLTRYTENRFDRISEATIGIEMGSRNMIIDDKIIKLRIWDTAGQERFRSIIKSYYRDASVVIFVYDVTDRNSFENIQMWLEIYRNEVQHNTPQFLYLIGTKLDQIPHTITAHDVITKEEADNYAKNRNMIQSIQISNSDTTYLDEIENLFNDIGHRMMRYITKQNTDDICGVYKQNSIIKKKDKSKCTC